MTNEEIEKAVDVIRERFKSSGNEEMIVALAGACYRDGLQYYRDNHAPKWIKEWHSVDESPKEDGEYLVEVQACDVPDEKWICHDKFENGRWGYAQFVNKWTHLPEPPKQ